MVILIAGLSIAVGTYFGGWRIIHTVGSASPRSSRRRVSPAEGSTAALILSSSHVGFPLSTTHVASGSVVGAGVGKKLAEVHWGVAGQMVVAWVLTLPAAAAIGAVAGGVASQGVGGTVLVAVVALALAAGAFWVSRRNPINAKNVNEVPVS
ncbi:inorganic phosphate transporter [Saccharopolyspora hattusasensis]|uniref:inorganic phosphate transporter n=1 Tax=Saccharopolyspora hattusasensis TaxID=1128679 RepID=UPI003D98E8C2